MRHSSYQSPVKWDANFERPSIRLITPTVPHVVTVSRSLPFAFQSRGKYNPLTWKVNMVTLDKPLESRLYNVLDIAG
jgi:hypothetical protein